MLPDLCYQPGRRERTNFLFRQPARGCVPGLRNAERSTVEDHGLGTSCHCKVLREHLDTLISGGSGRGVGSVCVPAIYRCFTIAGIQAVFIALNAALETSSEDYLLREEGRVVGA